jgi:hypothetical protein
MVFRVNWTIRIAFLFYKNNFICVLVSEYTPSILTNDEMVSLRPGNGFYKLLLPYIRRSFFCAKEQNPVVSSAELVITRFPTSLT